MTESTARQKILITGGMGYLGAKLCRHLAEAGHQVTAIDRAQPTTGAGWENWKSLLEQTLTADLTQPGLAQEVLRAGFDTVIYTAALGYQFKGSLAERVQNDVDPLNQWLEAFTTRNKERASHPPAKFIFLSTQRVLGEGSFEKVITEATPAQPDNPNAEAHWLGEKRVSATNQKTANAHFLSVRLSNVYGAPEFFENKCWAYLLNELCLQAVQLKEIALQSDGTALRDFIHISDFSEAMRLIVEEPLQKTDSLFNIGSGQTNTVLEAALAVAEMFDSLASAGAIAQPKARKRLRVRVQGKDVIADEKSRNKPTWTFDNSKLRALGKTQFLSLKDGAAELFKYLGNRP